MLSSGPCLDTGRWLSPSLTPEAKRFVCTHTSEVCLGVPNYCMPLNAIDELAKAY